MVMGPDTFSGVESVPLSSSHTLLTQKPGGTISVEPSATASDGTASASRATQCSGSAMVTVSPPAPTESRPLLVSVSSGSVMELLISISAPSLTVREANAGMLSMMTLALTPAPAIKASSPTGT